MLCENCNKNQATTHIRQSINGNESEMYLCKECADEMGVLKKIPAQMNFGVSNLIDNFLNFYAKSGNDVKSCDKCGTTLSEVKTNGLVGCEHCYDTFFDELLPSITRIQKDSKHIGKGLYVSEENDEAISEKNEDIYEFTTELKSLKVKLKKAIEIENYEEAAKIRDEIKKIEDERGN